MKKGLIIGIVAVAAVVLIAVLYGGSNKPNEASVPDSNPVAAPQFSLKNYTGQTVSLSDFKGKTVIINSWASWCPFCRKELPDFAAVQKELGGKVVVIAIDRGESLETAKSYSDNLGVINSLVLLLDPADSFYSSIGGFSMPETIFVDKNGLIRDHKRGPMDAAEIKMRTEKILN